MGQKVNPNILRVGITRAWESNWYASRREYADLLLEDIAIRKYIFEKFQNAGVSQVHIERFANKTHVNIHTSKPGVIIGRQGDNIAKLKVALDKKFNGPIEVNIIEIKAPDLDAKIVAANIAHQISRRIPYRRAVKFALSRVMEQGAKGIKVQISGRLNGAEIARSETYKEGNIPLHTFRSNVTYALEEANTTYGIIGVKVWICKGEVFDAEQAA